MRSFLFDTCESADAQLTPDLLEASFEQASLWPLDLLSLFFGHCQKPRSAALAYAKRRVQKGELCTTTVDLPSIPPISGPLARSNDLEEPDFEKLSYFALKRVSQPSVPTKVFWPSASFAARHGRWTGSDRLQNPTQLVHSALCTATWLHFLRTDAVVAFGGWMPEGEYRFIGRHERHLGPIPDAFIQREGEQIAIEVLGAYPAAWITHHVEQFEYPGRDWNWELY